jgi:hypothetical protein
MPLLAPNSKTGILRQKVASRPGIATGIPLVTFWDAGAPAVYVLATIMPPRRFVSLISNILPDTTIDPKLVASIESAMRAHPCR